MSAGQSAFMNSQMAYMAQEMEAEFSKENDDASEDDMAAANFSRLTLEEHASSSSGSSSTIVRADRHTVIPGDYTMVDNKIYQTNFDSYKRNNNIVKNSFGQGQQEIIGLGRR
jgi:hypothetical protein